MPDHNPAILVAGGVTIDTLRLPGETERRISPGGAGLYTALAVRAAGGRVRLFAQRPDPMPDLLSAYDRLLDWSGPTIPLERLPRLDIIHHGGGRAELAGADWGVQPEFSPADLPDDLSGFEIAHIAAMTFTDIQIDFARACRQRGVPRISAGTYGRQVYENTDAVRQLMAISDFFFMNENEARGLFGSPDAVAANSGQVVFVTLGERGAFTVRGDGVVLRAPALPAAEFDPTGAGDSFCGAALAVLVRGGGLDEALEAGTALAARTIEGLGPSNLLP